MVTGAVNQYVSNREADQASGANQGGPTSKASVANAKGGQGDLLMTVPVAGRLPSAAEKGERTASQGVGAQPFPYRGGPHERGPIRRRPICGRSRGQKRNSGFLRLGSYGGRDSRGRRERRLRRGNDVKEG